MTKVHLIVNLRAKTYTAVPANYPFNDGWEDTFPHTCGADWWDIQTYTLWSDQVTDNGLSYVYDLCRDGGLFTLFYDLDHHTAEDVEAAKAYLRANQDVVKLKVVKLRKYQPKN